ncbi:DotI/IcmL family type IV secretion protein [Legionella gresilensis]|uniref:DotI/IcmL family type IV secretion protein n=1 Tax=Legionella gresilensis TaxID=91823 RepID=UPI001041B836|nr:DotI/IcmL family type IV secretion protein [Legionella gresilensis]
MQVRFSNIKRLITSACLLLPFTSFSNNACPRLDNDTKIASWAYEVMLQTYNLNFVNPTQGKAQAYFTKSAWLNYKKEFNLNDNLKEIVNKKLVSSVGLKDTPLFLRKSSNSWTVSLPLIINYRSALAHQIKNINVELTIVKDKKADDCLKVAAIHKTPISKKQPR